MIRVGRVSASTTIDASGWGVSLTYWPGRAVALKVMRTAFDRVAGHFALYRGRLVVRFNYIVDFQHSVSGRA